MTETKSKRGRMLRIALSVLGVLLVLGLMVWGIRGLMGGKGETHKKPPKISLLPDRPPPPPPPPPKEKPEPPKAEQKEIKAEAPKEPQPQAQNEPLKMEGAAGDGPSAFAAGTVKNEYIGGSSGGSGAIGGSRMQQGLFADRLQRHLQEELNRNRKLRETDYRVNLRLWIARDGTVQRAELAQSTGNADVDALLQQTLLQVAAMREAPPENLQQPIRIRVTARGGR